MRYRNNTTQLAWVVKLGLAQSGHYATEARFPVLQGHLYLNNYVRTYPGA